MIITVDEAIPYWEEAFGGLGETRPFSGRNLGKKAILDADALVVRTVAPIHAPLLDGSKVRLVASASAGTDHVDQEYLKARGIGFEYAPGCNANAVSEYLSVALSVFADRRGWHLEGRSLAVIGAGHVGSLVAEKAKALGMDVALCDPPLRDLTGNSRYRDFADVLGADFLSFHVPLTARGAYPTYHMLRKEVLDRLAAHQVVINASRGAVICNRDLKEAVLGKKIEGAILDVWENEPEIDYSLLDIIDIGTPHIAGSSLDGKVRATEMVCRALHRFFGIPDPWNGERQFAQPTLLFPDPKSEGREALRSVLLQAYNILEDDGNLRQLGTAASTEKAGPGFDLLRSSYNFRPEFRHFIVVLNERSLQLSGTFKSLGFQVRRVEVP